MPADLQAVDARDVPALLAALRRALDGGPAVLPYADRPPELPPHDPRDLPAGLALCVATSGSTGSPKRSLLTAEALTASARATELRLGGPGRWLLAVPAAHIAGIQVLVRSLLAGTDPVVLDLTGGFTPHGFAEAAARLTGRDRRFVSLVPTQVARLLADDRASQALAGFDAVVTGGAAVPPALRARAQDRGVKIVATYGMSETSGGCVYDGTPLAGARIEIGDDGRVHLGGPMLAHGYLGRSEATRAAFETRDSSRWFATDDLGSLDRAGRLNIFGRRDDVIVTGGMKVHPRTVEEAALHGLDDIGAAVAVGIPDPEWGQAIALALATERTVTTAQARAALRDQLAAYALPRVVVTLPHLPERGPGKPDRAAIAALIRARVGD